MSTHPSTGPGGATASPRGGRVRATLRRRLPIIDWVARSTAETRRSDLVAGLTIAAMLVPQSMAYAALAGMPPVTGLYAATVPLVVYAVLGTSGQLAFGPVAIVSLLTASTLAPLADGDPGTYAALAGMLALLVGGSQVLLGLVRAGRITSLLSHPVVSGFTSAAAIVIATSQLDKLFGISVGSPDGWLERIAAILGGLDATNVPTLLVGVASIGALVLGKRLGSRVPMALVVVVVATVAVPLVGLDTRGVAVLGEVPSGFPVPTLPTAPLDTILALVPGAIVIALLSYLEGISVARAIAARTRDRLDPDQELLASGAANLAAGMVQAFPVAGGFSRTAVNHSAGARSPLASLVTAAGVLLALLVLAPLFATLPEVVLAAVVLVAVASLVDLREAVHVWRIERTDGLALAVTFLATLGLGVEIGIGVGVATSLVLSLWRVGVPSFELVRDVAPGRPLAPPARLPGPPAPPARIDVLHVTGDLLPASGVRLLEAVEAYAAEDPGAVLVLDLAGVPSADASGVQALVSTEAACRAPGAALHLAAVRPGVAQPLARAHVVDRFAGVHPDVDAAVRALSADGGGEPSPDRARLAGTAAPQA